MTGWRTALRLARREARRARGRSALIVAMIALPLAGLAFTAVYHDTFTLTPGERADRLMGTGQAAIRWPSDTGVQQDPAGSAFVIAQKPATGQAPPRNLDRLLTLLPPGSRAIPDLAGVLDVRTAAGTGTLPARMLDYADPLARGMLWPRSGDMPTNSDEVAITPAASRRLGTGVGGTVRLADGSRTFRVTAIVENPNDLSDPSVILRGDALPSQSLAAQQPVGQPEVTWLVATPAPLTWADVKRLNTHGVVAVSRQVLANPPGPAERYPAEFAGESRFALGAIGPFGGLALLEIILLAGAAFAVGARRRRHDLALVSASGGTPAHIRRIVLADGVVLGVVAAATGILLGIVAAAAGQPLLEEHLAYARAGAFRVFPAALALLAGLAVITGMLAALVPAWISARDDVVAALAGRRGITRSRRRWVALGAAFAGAGVGVAVAGAWRADSAVILIGVGVTELGLILCTPAIVGLVARLGGGLPLAPRISLRDVSRNRTAAAPAISAVMAAVVASLAIGIVLTANTERARDDYRSASQPGDVVLDHSGEKLNPRGERLPAAAIDTLRRMVPVEQVHEFGVPRCGSNECTISVVAPPLNDCPYAPWVLRRDPTPAEQRGARQDSRCTNVDVLYNYFGRLTDQFTIVIEPDAVGAVTGLAGTNAEQAAAALRSGAVVVDNAWLLDGDRITLRIAPLSLDPGLMKDPPQRTVSPPGFALPQRLRAPLVMMTPATAKSLGLGANMSLAVASTSRMPTVAEQDQLRAALGTSPRVYVERGPATSSDTRNLLLLATVAGLITLGAAAIATGLTAVDSRADLGTLAAIGASPLIRRALSISQAGIIAGLGSLLGAAAGLGAAMAVLYALNRGYATIWPAPTPYPLVVPWLNLGIALLVVPATAMLGAGLLTRPRRLPIERRL